MTQVDQIRIVVVYPQDALPQRNLVRNAINELNQSLAPRLRVSLKFDDFTSVAPDYHSDGPQGLIDSQLDLSQADIVVALFHKRLGASLDGGRSGTEHEVLQALEARRVCGSPVVMVYLWEGTPELGNEDEEREWRALCEFKARIRSVLYCPPFTSDEGFASCIRVDLINSIFEKANARPTSACDDASLCWSASATPTILRCEGLAERVADLDITFAGIPHGAHECLSSKFDVQVYLNTFVSNRLLDDNQLTDALLVLDRTEPGSRDNWPARTTVRGRRESMNSLVFPDVPIDLSGVGGKRVARIVNLRANATGVPRGISATGPVCAYVDVRPGKGASTIAVATNHVATVGLVQPSFTFSLCDGAGGSSVPFAFSRATGVNRDLAAGLVPSDLTASFRVRFKEMFAGAFTTRNAEVGEWSLLTEGAEKLTMGTRFMVRFYPIPAGVSLYVTMRNLSATAHVPLAQSCPKAIFVAEVSGVGDGGRLDYNEKELSVATAHCEMPITCLEICEGGSYAVWELVESVSRLSASLLELEFGVVLAASRGSASLGSCLFRGTLAPVSATIGMSKHVPVPRFQEHWTFGEAFAVHE